MAAIEDVAFRARAIFARDGHVPSIVEGLFERVTQIVLGRKVRNPAFEFMVLTPLDHFQLVGCQVPLRLAHARVSSSCSELLPICTSGLLECAGRTCSFNIASASGSLYLLENVARTVPDRKSVV